MARQLAKRILPARAQWFLQYQRLRLRNQLELELPALAASVRPGSVAIDVGANVGIYAYALARRGATVHAFEPLPDCARIVRTIPGVHVHEVALSDAPGRFDLHIPRVDGRAIEAEASLRPPHGPHDRVSVDVRTLDAYGFRDVSVIKIDVEGHETAMLAGARETIEREKPVLLIEIEERHSGRPTLDVIREVEALGYTTTYCDWNRRWHPIAAFDPVRDQTPGVTGYVQNFLFHPR